MRAITVTPNVSLHKLPTLFWLLLILGIAGAFAIAVEYVALSIIAPADLVVTVPVEAGHVRPDATLHIRLRGIGKLTQLSLAETRLDRDGRPVAERFVPVALHGEPDGRFHERYIGSIDTAEGGSLLQSDAHYRLTAVATLWAFSLPLPRSVALRQDVAFSTPRTPQPDLTANGRVLRYGEQIAIAWNLPMASVDLRVEPPARLLSWIDPSDPTVTYAALPDVVDGRRYTFHVESARSSGGIAMLAPQSFIVVAPLEPRPATADPVVKISFGQRVPVTWTVPIQSYHLRIEPAAPLDVVVDPHDRRRSTIGLKEFQQGQIYAVVIDAVEADNGAPLAEPFGFKIVTPPALQVTSIQPEDGAEDLPVDTAPTLTFGEAIADRAAVEAAIVVDPSVKGHFEWPSPNQVRFVPDGGWPYHQRIHLQLAGGPNGPHASSGGYLSAPVSWSFTTKIKKVIDVDLTHQRLVLLEDDHPVFQSPTATGVRGGETPPGTFYVQYKMRTTRMRGYNPSGSYYDIPNVPWVLAYSGDYTIHGAPWRQRFGVPGSAGCVSLPTEAARRVFEWAPVGTPILIHY